MSRLKRLKEKKYSKNKYKVTCRIIFFILMLIVTSSVIFLIDYRINEVLDEDSKGSFTKYIVEIF